MGLSSHNIIYMIFIKDTSVVKRQENILEIKKIDK